MTTRAYVRVKPDAVREDLFLCGFLFLKTSWKPVDVDDATLLRLRTDFTLEVSLTDPGSGVGDGAVLPGFKMLAHALVDSVTNRVKALMYGQRDVLADLGVVRSEVNQVTGMLRFSGAVGSGSFGPLTLQQALSADVPTITYPDSAGYGAESIDATDPRFTRWGGFDIRPDSGGFPKIQSVSTSWEGSMPFYREFGYDGASLVIRAGVDAGKQKWFLWVNDKITNPDGYTATAGVKDVTLTFGSARPRTITILACWGEHRITMASPTNTIWKVSRSKGRRAAVITDSWGPGESDPMAGWAYPTLIGLGYSDICPSMQGGTGYVASGTAGQGRRNFADRLADEVLAVSPDDAFIGGSINDTESNAGSYAANVRSVLSRLKSAGARVFAFGTQFIDPSKTAEYSAQDAVLSALCSENGVAMLSTSGWLTGSGKIGATTGVGNRDVYRRADGDHLSDIGSAYWSRRLIAEWANSVCNAEI